VTNREWREELLTVLDDAEWEPTVTGVSDVTSECFALLRNQKDQSRRISVSLLVFETPGRRQIEILRQLAETITMR
jgi:hypothetical protein